MNIILNEIHILRFRSFIRDLFKNIAIIGKKFAKSPWRIFLALRGARKER